VIRPQLQDRFPWAAPNWSPGAGCWRRG
jgi:hypothetical protein